MDIIGNKDPESPYHVNFSESSRVPNRLFVAANFKINN